MWKGGWRLPPRRSASSPRSAPLPKRKNESDMSSCQPSRPIRLHEISQAIGGQIVGDPETVVSGASSLEEARPGDVSYVEADRLRKAALKSKAAALVVERHLTDVTRPQLVTQHPKYAFARIVQQFFTP